MNEVQIENLYTSAACNRTPHCADWGKNGWLIYGSCNAVCIVNPTFMDYSAKVVYTYVRHTQQVVTVKWVSNKAKSLETHFVSGSHDNTAMLWNMDEFNVPKCYPMKGHTASVSAVAGIQKDSELLLIATASADSTVRLWTFNGIYCMSYQTISLGNGFCFAIALAPLPATDKILIAFSTEDNSIEIWTRSCANDELNRALKLTGHEDWVRGLDIVQEEDDDGDLLLASCSQDSSIRLWRISLHTACHALSNSFNILNMPEDSTDEIRLQENYIKMDHNDMWYAVRLESILCGHEGWVYGVHWSKNEKGLNLLSASLDKTLIIWENTDNDIWMEKLRVGDVGGNSLGFFGGKFSGDGQSICGHSYQGGFHVWKQSTENEDTWLPEVVVGGHYGEVRDIAWEPQGEFLVSVSVDQTTRVHAPWVNGHDENVCTWHELSRPQVHGYDMQTITMLTRYKFASGAEEKIVRTFQAPKNFIENFRRISNIDNDPEGDALLNVLPKGASVPSLGLSNKAVYNDDESVKKEECTDRDVYPENYFVPVSLKAPPQEEDLRQNTLWPEMQKLYGHGYEIYALASSEGGRLLASSCRAKNIKHAQIILWDTLTGKQIQSLSSHDLTIAQMRFSPNGQYLLSVSRDRRWSLFERNELNPKDGLPSFSLAATTDKSNGIHVRIIWSCDWSHDGKFFVTSSRDGKVIAWTKAEDGSQMTSTLNGWYACHVLQLKNESITAVAFAGHNISDDSYVIAIGMESGLLHIYELKDQFKLLQSVAMDAGHHLAINRLQYRPKKSSNLKQLQLASCSNDTFVRIYNIKIP